MKKLLAFLLALTLCLSLLPMVALADESTTYQVRGSFNGWGSDDDMADRGDGVYTLSMALPAGSYEYKIAVNKGWDESYPSGNIWFSLATDATVVFVFDPVTKYAGHYVEGAKYYLLGTMNGWSATEMTQDGDLYVWTGTLEAGECKFKVADTPDWTGSAWPGSDYIYNVAETAEYRICFDPALKTITVDDGTGTPPPAPASVYVVAGDAGLTGVNWDPSAVDNKMTLDGTLYSITFEDVLPGTYGCKVVMNSNWDASWPAQNYSITVDAVSDVTVTFDPATYTVSHTATPTGEIVDIVDKYVLAGDAALTGEEWNPNSEANQLTEEDGIYKISYQNVAAGTYHFKIVKNNSWGTSWPSDNYELVVEVASDVTVTFDPSTNEINVVLTPLSAPGPEPDPVYVVAGSAGLCGSEWNGSDPANQMTEVDGKYIKVYENVDAGTYALKVVKNGTTWIPDGMGNDIIVTAKQGATVTVTYDPNNTETPVTAIAEGGSDPIVPVEDKYHVVGSGSIFGGELWTASDDHLMTKEENGTYSKTYTAPEAGELSFKVLKNGVIYIPDGMGTEVKVTVKKGASVTVTYDPNNAEAPVSVSVTGGEEEPPKEEDPPVVIDPNAVYYVAGVKELCGSEWNCNDEANQMTLDPTTGKYSITYRNLVPNTRYAFKITDGSWDNSWPSSDREFAVAEAGDVTITFDPATKTVTLSDNAIKYVPALSDSDKLVVAGSASLCGSEWNATDEANLLVKNADGSYSITYKSVAPGDYELKVVINGSTWIGGSDGNNVKLTVTKTCDVTVTYTPQGGIKVTGSGVTVHDPKNPQTGDITDLTALWAVMLLASVGFAVTVSGKKKFF